MSTPDSDEEMVRLRAEFPGHRIGTETEHTLTPSSRMTLVNCESL